MKKGGRQDREVDIGCLQIAAVVAQRSGLREESRAVGACENPTLGKSKGIG